MGRLSSLGSNWIYRQQYRSIADDLRMIRAVTLHEIHELIQEFPLRMTSTVGVGPVAELPQTV